MQHSILSSSIPWLIPSSILQFQLIVTEPILKGLLVSFQGSSVEEELCLWWGICRDISDLVMMLSSVPKVMDHWWFSEQKDICK